MPIEPDALQFARALAHHRWSRVRLYVILLVTAMAIATLRAADTDAGPYIPWLGIPLVVVWAVIGWSFTGRFEERGARQWLGNPTFPMTGDIRVNPRRHPDREAYLLITLLAVSLLSVRWLLSRLDVAGLGPADAAPIVGAITGAPAVIIAAGYMAAKLIQAWGGKAKETGEGSGAAASGSAEVVRANAEGEAQLIRAKADAEAQVLRAKAQLMRAQAEMKRAELGLEPLPAPQIPSADGPLGLPPASDNGSVSLGDA
ncbi:hypothetical protein [Streptomyces nigra]